MKKIGIIPARMASSRFPGKPMKKILGIPMIEHCYIRAKMCLDLDEVYVATCDKEIYEYILKVGGKAVMTADAHERATERAGEALLKIEKINKLKYDLVIMIQGDEPLVHPQMLSEMINPIIKNNDIDVTNLMVRLIEAKEINSADIVKVVVNSNNRALYMSREAIPSNRNYKDKVIVGLQSCKIYDCNLVKRCNNCQGIGHFYKDCPTPNKPVSSRSRKE